MKRVKCGVIGCGLRGMTIIENIIDDLSDKAEITAVCDVYNYRTEEAANLVEKKTGTRPFANCDYNEIIDCDEVDAIIIMSGWESHFEIATRCMEKGKPVGSEVGGAYDIQECFDLVETYERTKTPYMFLENCCYGRRELMVLNMVRKGLFGDIVHCEGGYMHDLRDEVAYGEKTRHYRFNNYLNRNAENYPTHELGPIAKVLNINKGNRMVSLLSTSSEAKGLHEFIKQNSPDDEKLMKCEFKQADIVKTFIKCANGETITLTLDTTLPRFYSRDFTVRGTKGMYEESTDSVFLDKKEDRDFDFNWKEKWGNAESYLDEYEHPIWKNYLDEGVKGTHDGMDYLVYGAFFDSIINNTNFPIDVYDAVALMCITPLSEQSIKEGRWVEIPDFTNGKWKDINFNKCEGKYSLDK